MPDSVFDLSQQYVHLGLGARVIHLPDFEWTKEALERYEAAHAGDGDEGRLVMVSSQTSDWTTWERHPAGEELVYLLRGRVALVQEIEGSIRTTELAAGQAAINPRGVWHTSDVREPGEMFFITPGRGTEHRPR
jgi:quercetin dioxygenase-like cupin family protein